ncbi:hypothetical protein AB0N81_05555 [Streptomyces sp. NPDC093510]|uniref:hypothetical protein n=1 Tax=Streptomyces sp. NPDC093510 TaxID=3155199 RepID=UPI003434B6D2
MRNARLLTVTALAVATGALAVPASAAPGPPAGGLEIRPATVTPGSTVTVHTTACGSGGTAAGDASAVGAGPFALAPAAHQESREAAAGRFKVPPSAQPGTYEIVATCSGSGGSGAKGKRIAGDLVVTITSTAAAGERHQQLPRGHVKTGVGGALGPDPVQTAAGVAALAVAAAGGTWLLHRRARGDRI